jgi:hypothetical protein
MLPPRGSAPPRLRRNQPSDLWHGGPSPHVMHLVHRFLCAEKANRCVKKHATACDSAPLRPRRNRQPSLWHGGLGPRVILLGRWYLRTEKSHHRSRQYHASSGPPQKMDFQNQCSDSRHPTHGPTKPLSVEVTGQLAAGTGVAVDVTKGGPAVITLTGAQKHEPIANQTLAPPGGSYPPLRRARGPLSVH